MFNPLITVFQLSEIKKDSKNEKLHTKKNKFNVEIKKNFQMKLIQCYKLAIETTKVDIIF